MSNQIKISELSAFPQQYADNSTIIPVVSFGNTYKLSVSALNAQIELSASVDYLASNEVPYVEVISDAEIRNKFDFTFGIPQGLSGISPVIGATAETAEGEEPGVTVSGTPQEPIFNFSIPRGVIGDMPSVSATVTIIDKDETASVVKTGTPEEPVLNFSLPRGSDGLPGIGINFKGRRESKASLEAVLTPLEGDAWFVTNDESFTPAASSVFYVYGLNEGDQLIWLSGGALQGPSGANGLNATLEVSAVSGTSVNVENLGTTTQAKLKFTIPPGPRGFTGDWSSPQSIKIVTSATYTLSSVDAGSLILINTDAATAATFQLRVPTTTGNFLSGQKVDFVRTGTAAVSCVAVAGATVNGTPGLKLRDIYSAASAIYVENNKWIVVGDLNI